MNLDRIRTVIGEMSLEEKAALCGCGPDFVTRAVKRLMVPSVRLPIYGGESMSALGCTFSRELMAEFGKVLSAEAILDGAALAGPLSIGLVRQPMAVGSERMLGEDAFAVSELVSAAVDASPVKMLACGLLGGEYPFAERSIDSRALSELYLKPFLRIAKKLGGAEIPAGSLNGEAVSTSRRFVTKLTDYLSTDAMLINELGSVTDKAAAVAAGACFQTVDNTADNAALFKAVKDGKLFEKRLDAVLERLLCLVTDYAEKQKKPAPEIVLNEFFEQELAEKSAVLLKNDTALPLMQGAAVAVWGDLSKAETATVGNKFKTKIKPTEAEAHLVFLRKSELGLSATQCALVQRAAAFGKKTIVILLSDRALPLPFEQEVQAILYAPYVGDAAVKAIVKVLTGEVNPSGKLNVSWAYSESDYPANAFKRAEGRGMFCYESVMNGYRYFDTFSRPVLYPFGHGLSYTGFAVSKLKCVAEGDNLTVDFVVKNIGTCDGETAVFVFGCLDSTNIFGLKSRLAGLERIKLCKGENIALHFNLNLNELSVYDAASHEWLVPGGKYQIRVGFSLADVRAEAQVKVPRSTRFALGLTQKDVPSYYESGAFNPLGTDVEKVMGVPLLMRKSAASEYCTPAIGKNCLRAKKAAIKKLVRFSALSVSAAEKTVNGFSEYALNKFVKEI